MDNENLKIDLEDEEYEDEEPYDKDEEDDDDWIMDDDPYYGLPGIDPEYEEWLCAIGEDPWGGHW